MTDLARPVGIWIRVSTEDQVRGESPEHHEHRARGYAEAKGWAVVRLYDLSAVSGKTVMEHPECQAMLADVREGRIKGLIFSKLARLARNTRELLDFADFFQEQDADLVSLQESIDTSTPAGRLFYTMIAGMAQWEREEIADRVRASVRVRAQLGKNTGGAAPFGYQWLDGKIVLHPEEAPVRRLAFELFAEHKRIATVMRLLNEAGHRTRRGGKFSRNSVRRLIAEPIAKGKRRANYSRSLGPNKHWELKPESEWVWSEVEPIVSEELWNECNAIIDSWRTHRPPSRKTVHLFSGLLYCHCGTKMYKPSNTPKYTCAACKNKIPTADLETIFLEQLKGFFLDTDEVARQLERADQALGGKRKIVAGLERDRERVRAEMDKVYQLYIDGEISSTGFGERNRPLEERLAQLDAEIPRLQGEIDSLSIQHISAAEVVHDAKNLATTWPTLSDEEKRSIVDALVDRIEIRADSVEFRIGVSPDIPPAPPPRPRLEEEPPPSSQTATKGVHNLRGYIRQ